MITSNNTKITAGFNPDDAQCGAWTGFPGKPVKAASSPDWDDTGTRRWYQDEAGTWWYRLTSKGFARATPEQQEELDALCA